MSLTISLSRGNVLLGKGNYCFSRMETRYLGKNGRLANSRLPVLGLAALECSMQMNFERIITQQ